MPRTPSPTTLARGGSEGALSSCGGRLMRYSEDLIAEAKERFATGLIDVEEYEEIVGGPAG